MYQLNLAYNGKQLAENVFGISGKSFYNKKEFYLNHLSQYFVWHQDKTKYILDSVIKPFETPKDKNSKEVKMQFYKERTDDIVTKEPYNSGANIARNISATNNKYNVKEETISKYVRTILKGFYISIDDRWSRPSEDHLHYIPLTAEEVAYLQSLFKSKSNNDLNYKYCAEYEAGNIDRQEFLELLGNNVLNDYQTIMTAFQEKYGYRPIKTKKFQPAPEKNTSFSWD